MTDRELELIEAIPPEALAHFDDLEGVEENLPTPDAPSFAMRSALAAPTGTFFTASVMLATLNLWRIPFRLYRSDWETHNRNAAQGWGPYCGHVVHCFGSDLSDDSSNAYLSRGDLARGMPGPLSQFSITDDGMLWVQGWGTANHTGYMEKGLHSLVLRDAAYLDRDYRPSTSGSSPSAGIGPVNPHYSAVEMTYGRAPTGAQIRTNELLSAALMHACGPGYTGGSVVGHREATTQRGDPTGIPMYQHRNNVNRILKAGPPSPVVVKPPTPVPATTPPTPTKETFLMALTDAQQKELYDAVMALTKRTPPGNALQRKAGDGSIPRVLDTGDGFYIVNILRGLDKRLADVEAKLDGPEQPPAA